MRVRSSVLLVWAVVATLVVVFFALPSTPTVAPKPPAEDPRGDRPRGLQRGDPEPRKARSAESLEGFLALALKPPAAESSDGRPVEVRVRELVRLSQEAEQAGDWRKNTEIRWKLYALIASEESAHLALMELLRVADDEQVGDIMEFLVWNPFVKQVRVDEVIEKIEAEAREMLANDPNVARREAAIFVLYRYGKGGGRQAFEYGLERLDLEPSPEVRNELLSEMSVVGIQLGLTREEAAPFVDRLRDGLKDGKAWCALSLAWWSTDAEDFRLIKEKLATARVQRDRELITNAFQGDNLLVRDRTDEARAVLIGLLDDPAESATVRRRARSFLTETYGPMDVRSAEAVRRYDAGQRGR